MGRLFIPTDRIGLVSIQNSISTTTKVINQILSRGQTVDWYLNGFRLFQTPNWPEGHYYQCGYGVEDREENRFLLDNDEIFYEEVGDLSEVPKTSRSIRKVSIAVYDGRGAGREFSDPLVDVLDMGGFTHSYVTDMDIRDGKLDNHDILLVPGSPDAGECYYAGLGDLGYEKIREFIKTRGHYLGVCGGAYLPLTAYHDQNPYWLNILDATDQEDLDYWRTGSAFVRCRIDEDRHPLFAGISLGKSSSMNLVYWEGPAIQVKGANVRPLAHFESLLAGGGGPLAPYWDLQDNHMAREAVKEYYNPLTQDTFDRLLKQRTAFAEGEYCGHKILLFSPHPEMGNVGYGPRADSLNFLLIYNGLFYLASEQRK